MSMDALVQEVLGQARGIARDVLRREGTTLRTATVTSVSPLRIRYDGEAEASVVSPRTAAVVGVGNRVVVAKARGQATVLGVLGDTAWIEVPLGNGWSPRTAGGYFPGIRVRRRGTLLEVNGAVQGGAASSVIGVIPDGRGLRPKYATFVPSTLASGGSGQCHISTGGNITHSYGTDAPGFLALNVTIPLD